MMYELVVFRGNRRCEIGISSNNMKFKKSCTRKIIARKRPGELRAVTSNSPRLKLQKVHRKVSKTANGIARTKALPIFNCNAMFFSLVSTCPI